MDEVFDLLYGKTKEDSNVNICTFLRRLNWFIREKLGLDIEEERTDLCQPIYDIFYRFEQENKKLILEVEYSANGFWSGPVDVSKESVSTKGQTQKNQKSTSKSGSKRKDPPKSDDNSQAKKLKESGKFLAEESLCINGSDDEIVDDVLTQSDNDFIDDSNLTKKGASDGEKFEKPEPVNAEGYYLSPILSDTFHQMFHSDDQRPIKPEDLVIKKEDLPGLDKAKTNEEVIGKLMRKQFTNTIQSYDIFLNILKIQSDKDQPFDVDNLLKGNFEVQENGKLKFDPHIKEAFNQAWTLNSKFLQAAMQNSKLVKTCLDPKEFLSNNFKLVKKRLPYSKKAIKKHLFVDLTTEDDEDEDDEKLRKNQELKLFGDSGIQLKNMIRQ